MKTAKGKKVIYYKNYLGKWTKSDLKATKKNLDKVRKTVAENGNAEIFTVGVNLPSMF